MGSFDVQLFRAINGASDAWAPLMVFLSEGNKQTWVRVALLLLFAFFLWKRSLRTPALVSVVAFPLANEVCDLLKHGLQMQRPNVELTEVVLRVNHLTSFGTASAHSANMMCVAVVFLMYNRVAGIAWLVVALMTGVSRIYVGVHYPSQVLLGWTVGALVGLCAVTLWRALQARALRPGSSSGSPEADQ